MNFHAILQDAKATLPEVVLAAALMLVILVDLTRLKKSVPFLALVGLAAGGYFVLRYFHQPELAPRAVFGRAYAVDGLSAFFKLTFLGAAFLVVLLSIPAVREWQTGKGEFFALLLSCTFGMLLMSSANDFLLMYLSLEFVSITSYILSGLLRKNRKSAEASLKYIIYGAGASGFMIYGMSFVYGLTGTLDVAQIGLKLRELNVPPTLTLITSVLIMAGFGYKIAAVPFHMWCPDVYEGAPTPVTAFFSVGPKAAGFAMLIRFVMNIYPQEGGPFEWKLVVALLAVLTMAVGNFGALPQQNLKRLLAYSSIAHAGYLLIGFNAFEGDPKMREAQSALLVYLFVYVIMNLGAFLVVLVLEDRYGVETVDGCRGLGWRSPGIGALMTVFLISLTGLPPTAGYTGKFLLFSAVVNHGLGPQRQLGIALVVIAVIFSVVSLFYYMRIVAAMYLGKVREGEAERPVPAGATWMGLVSLLGVATIFLGLDWGWLQSMVERAAGSVLLK